MTIPHSDVTTPARPGVAAAIPKTDKTGNSVAVTRVQTITPEQRHGMICEVAYFLAQERGFEPGGELQDWLAAEAQVNALLATGRKNP